MAGAQNGSEHRRHARRMRDEVPAHIPRTPFTRRPIPSSLLRCGGTGHLVTGSNPVLPICTHMAGAQNGSEHRRHARRMRDEVPAHIPRTPFTPRPIPSSLLRCGGTGHLVTGSNPVLRLFSLHKPVRFLNPPSLSTPPNHAIIRYYLFDIASARLIYWVHPHTIHRLPAALHSEAFACSCGNAVAFQPLFLHLCARYART
jgi:hypothetical protein